MRLGMYRSLPGVVIGAWLLVTGLAEAQAPPPEPTYQPAFHHVGTANEMSAFVYEDDVVHCVVFRNGGTQGLGRECFEKRPTDPSGPVQFYWATKVMPGPVHMYVYMDPVMRCTIFREEANGYTSVCLDRRGVQP